MIFDPPSRAGERPPVPDAPTRPAPAWGVWLGALLALVLLGAAVAQLRGASAEVLALVRRLPPTVWVAFAALYLIQPVADFVIYRRLWPLPRRALAVMFRKVVINEVVLGYSGELYFYFWLRRWPELRHAALGAIKDVNLLSALGANLLTLALLPACWLAMRTVDLGEKIGPALWPGLGLVAASFGVLLFGRRVFSLPPRSLAFVAAAHALRLAATTGLTLLVWSLALPDEPLGVWILLLTGRLVLARLPFLPNKELVFANLILALFGTGAPTTLLLATLGIVTLLTHLFVFVCASAERVLPVQRHLVSE